MDISDSTTRKTIELFWQHITRYKKFAFPLLVSIPGTVLIMDFLQPYILSRVLQRVSTHSFNPNLLWESFGSYIIAYAIGALASGVAGWRLNIWLIWNLELRVQRDLAQRVFNHLMEMSAGFHANRFAGSLTSQANKLTGAYVRFVDTTVFNMYTLATALVASMVILAPKVPLYAIVMVSLSIIYIVGTIKFSKPVRVANTREAEMQSEQTGNLADSITNVLAIKSFSTAPFEQERYGQSAHKTMRAGYKSMTSTMIRETYSSVITSVIGVSALLIAIVGTGRLHIEIGTLYLIVAYTGGIAMRLWEFQNVLRQYNRAFGDASDMVKILQIPAEVEDPVHPEKTRIHKGEIVFNNVVFAHDESRNTLFEGINLRMQPGEKVGLVGPSGGGKTTITKLLLRFMDIQSGAITIDGQDISKITQADLRSAITYVPQEPLLFHRTLNENISYGKLDASEKEIEKAAKKAHAHEFIEQLPLGYETLVGERGVKLSGGQRQRVAIARAMIKDAPILVLDEATSALDSESEKLIQDALWKLMEGKTAIVIAHRLSTIQHMDRIIVLDNGRVVEEGSHRQLLKNTKGLYAKLWAHQSGGFLED